MELLAAITKPLAPDVYFPQCNRLNKISNLVDLKKMYYLTRFLVLAAGIA